MKIAVATHSHAMIDADIAFNHAICKVKWSKQYVSAILYMSVKGMKNASAREKIVEGAIEQGCSHILFIDDDHIIHESMLPLLLEFKDEAMISGLINKRCYPFPQVGWVVNKDGMFAALDLPVDGRVYEVGVCAFGCTLINLTKLQELDKPYFQDTCDIRANGLIGNMRSDVILCERFRRLGYKIWIDSRVQVGHMTEIGIIYPHTVNIAKKYIEDFNLKMQEDTHGYYCSPKMAECTDKRSSNSGEVKCEIELEDN